jgi:hypothetical protein
MAFIPSAQALNLASQISIEPNLILEIEGIPIIFGSQNIARLWKFDEGLLFDTPNLRFDTPYPDQNARDYISLKKTSKSISQQVLPDKKGTSSTLKMSIELVDINGEVTEILKAGNNVEDLLGQRAALYIGFKQGSHPDDSIPLINGYIDSISPSSGSYIISVSHSENKKRQELFQVYTAKLTNSITDIQTVLDVDTTTNLLASTDSLLSHIQIEDEIMEVVSIDSDTQLTVIRSRLNTIAVPHDNDSDISSVYGLSGNAIELALKLYLSGGDEFYTELGATSFNDVNGSPIVNTIFFNDIDLINDVNVIDGDFLTSTGAINAQNNGTFTITDITEVSNGTYVTCESAGFVTENLSTATISFKSQYNVFPEGAGCGLKPFDIDITGHLSELDANFSSLPEYQFYLKEEISAKDFIDAELYFPSGLYSINRKAQISVKYTAPPLAVEDIPVFNSDNITNIDKIKVDRSTLKFLYNSVVFKFEPSVLKDKFLAGVITVDPEAKNRTDKATHTLKVESNGLRRGADTSILIQRQTNRFLQRYRYAATIYKGVEIAFKDSWNLEIGDVVEFGGEDVKIPDLIAGTTYTPKRLLEIINKSQDISTGKIKFDLLDTGFDIDAKYGVFSPSSNLTANSTTTKLELELSFYTGKVDTERQKWQSYVGQKIRVRNDDYTYDEITTITQLAPENDEVLNVEALPLTPPAGCFITIPDYDESSVENDADYKIRYTYNNHQATITAVTDASNFEVSTPERFTIGGTILVHSDDYARNQDTLATISNIVGDLLTLSEPLEFTPLIGDKVENMKFLDGLDSYRYI